MASDISVGSGGARSLQAESEDIEARKKALQQEGERKLTDLRVQNENRLEAERTSGEAAVSHIRRSTASKMETLRRDSDERVARETDTSARTYADLKRKTAEGIKSLDGSLKQRQEGFEEAIHDLSIKESEALKKTEEEQRVFSQGQETKRTKQESELQKMRFGSAARDHELSEKAKVNARRELAATESENEARLAEANLRYRDAYKKADLQGKSQLQTLKQQDESQLETERNRAALRSTSMQSKTHESEVKETRDAERRLSEIRDEYGKRIKETQERSGSANSTLARENEAEAQRTQVEGEASIAARQSNFQAEEKAVDNEHHATLDEGQKKFEAEELQQRKDYEAKMNRETKIQQDAMTEKTKRFHETFVKTETAQRQSLTLQKENFLKAAYKQAQSEQNKLSVAEAKSQDPFYATRDLGASLEETDGAYVFRAKVPSYERETIDVHVRPDRLTMQVARAAESKIVEGQQRTSVSTAQTFRQEFAFAKPVVAEKTIKRISEDGMLEVIVPKRPPTGPFDPV